MVSAAVAAATTPLASRINRTRTPQAEPREDITFSPHLRRRAGVRVQASPCRPATATKRRHWPPREEEEEDRAAHNRRIRIHVAALLAMAASTESSPRPPRQHAQLHRCSPHLPQALPRKVPTLITLCKRAGLTSAVRSRRGRRTLAGRAGCFPPAASTASVPHRRRGIAASLALTT